MKNNAFTLSEVLITLGVIGVVSAITMPVLIKNHQKIVVETKLKSIYTKMSEAIKLSELQNGTISEWVYPEEVQNADTTLEWFNKYLKPYLKHTSVTKPDDTKIEVTLADGTILQLWNNGVERMHVYVLFKPESKAIWGKDAFVFLINSDNTTSAWLGFEPYNNGIVDRETMKDGQYYACNINNTKKRHFCALLIMTDGWKISKDYPFFN